MNKLILIAVCLCLMGCNVSPFSPDTHQDIKNSGSIDEIKNNTNGIMAEIGNIKGTLKDVQDGLANIRIGGGDNSGVQILSGDGALLCIFSLSTIGMILYYFYKEKKVNKILSDEIKKNNDPRLHEGIIKAAAYTNVEKNIYNLLYKE